MLRKKWHWSLNSHLKRINEINVNVFYFARIVRMIVSNVRGDYDRLRVENTESQHQYLSRGSRRSRLGEQTTRTTSLRRNITALPNSDGHRVMCQVVINICLSIFFKNKNKSQKCLYANNLWSTALNWIFLMCLLLFLNKKVGSVIMF